MNPIGGQNYIFPRFYRHSFIVSMNAYETTTIQRIFTTISEWHFSHGFTDKIVLLAKNVASAICSMLKHIAKLFPLTPQKSHYVFSLHDAWRVFQGISMVPAKKLLHQEKLIRLWSHETLRVYSDRVTDSGDRDRLVHTITMVCRENYKIDLTKALGKRNPIDGGTVTENAIQNLLFGNFMEPDSDVKTYDEIDEMPKLMKIMNYYLNEFNRNATNRLNVVFFRSAVAHVMRVSRAIHLPQGHCLLIGDGGSGRRTTVRLASSMAGAKLFQLNANVKYEIHKWHDDIKRCLMHAGINGNKTVLLFVSTFTDQHPEYDTMLMEDIVALMQTYEIPNIFHADERSKIIDVMHAIAKEKVNTNA